MNVKRIVFIIFLLLSVTSSLFPQCGCVTGTIEALQENDSEKAMEKFSLSMHEEYYYQSSGGYAGVPVFDLSAPEITQVYKHIYELPPSQFYEHKSYYDSGIEILKTSKVIHSHTYNSYKANLILELDSKLTARREVYNYQNILNSLGYECGIPDGIIGNNTTKSIILFQKSHNINQSGLLDEETKNLLDEKYLIYQRQGLFLNKIERVFS